jgi:hypothetical protein
MPKKLIFPSKNLKKKFGIGFGIYLKNSVFQFQFRYFHRNRTEKPRKNVLKCLIVSCKKLGLNLSKANNSQMKQSNSQILPLSNLIWIHVNKNHSYSFPDQH